MADSEHWLYQGRQSHGWFGHGTGPRPDGPAPDRPGTLFDPADPGQRIAYVASGVMGHAPRQDRAQWAAALNGMSGRTLKTAVMAWQDAAVLGRDAFRTLLLDPGTSDETVDDLRRAAHGMVTGRTHDDLALAGDSLVAAIGRIGISRWPRLIAESARRADADGFGGSDPQKGRGTLRVADTVYVADSSPIRRVADGRRPDVVAAEARLMAIVHRVVLEEAPLLPPTSSPTVYGTMLHTLLKRAIDRAKIPGILTEQSFIDGNAGKYGERGTVRTDVIFRDGHDVVEVGILRPVSSHLCPKPG